MMMMIMYNDQQNHTSTKLCHSDKTGYNRKMTYPKERLRYRNANQEIARMWGVKTKTNPITLGASLGDDVTFIQKKISKKFAASCSPQPIFKQFIPKESSWKPGINARKITSSTQNLTDFKNDKNNNKEVNYIKLFTANILSLKKF